MMSAKLFVPSGGCDHPSGGEMFSPTQFGFDVSFPAYFLASTPLSLSAGDFSVRISAACAAWPPNIGSNMTALTADTYRTVRFTACPSLLRAEIGARPYATRCRRTTEEQASGFAATGRFPILARAFFTHAQEVIASWAAR